MRFCFKSWFSDKIWTFGIVFNWKEINFLTLFVCLSVSHFEFELSKLKFVIDSELFGLPNWAHYTRVTEIAIFLIFSPELYNFQSKWYFGMNLNVWSLKNKSKVWLVLPNFEGMIDCSTRDNYMTLTTMENLVSKCEESSSSKLENGFPSPHSRVSPHRIDDSNVAWIQSCQNNTTHLTPYNTVQLHSGWVFQTIFSNTKKSLLLRISQSYKLQGRD